MENISVIIPVYNVEKYLYRCLESVCNQTYRDLQIIVIDDGSTDKSAQICDDWATKDARITVIHQENKGVSAARNCGIHLAIGEYITFVDSDDWVEPGMYEQLVRALQQDKEAQMCVCEYYFVEAECRKAFSAEGVSRLSKEEAMIKLLRFNYPTSLYFCLYRCDIIKGNLLNPKTHYWEDMEYQWRLLKSVNYISVCKTPFYHLTSNPKSVTHQSLNDKHFTMFQVGEYIAKDIKKFYPEFVRYIPDMQNGFLLSAIDLALKSEKTITHSKIALIKKDARNNLHWAVHSTRLNGKDKLYIILWAFCPYLFINAYKIIRELRRKRS